NVTRMVEYTVGTDNLDGASRAALDAAITGSDATLELNEILPLLEVQSFTNDVSGTSGDDVLQGTAGEDEINAGSGHDTIYGHEGDDVINGWTGNDGMTGGEGSDYLTSWSGEDTYVWNLCHGHDLVYDDGCGTDKILFGAGIDAGDLT